MTFQWTPGVKGLKLPDSYEQRNKQKTSSIHKFILKIKQILKSHELKGHDHF